MMSKELPLQKNQEKISKELGQSRSKTLQSNTKPCYFMSGIWVLQHYKMSSYSIKQPCLMQLT